MNIEGRPYYCYTPRMLTVQNWLQVFFSGVVLSLNLLSQSLSDCSPMSQSADSSQGSLSPWRSGSQTQRLATDTGNYILSLADWWEERQAVADRSGWSVWETSFRGWTLIGWSFCSLQFGSSEPEVVSRSDLSPVLIDASVKPLRCGRGWRIEEDER